MRIELISGSPRPNSTSQRVALYLKKLLEQNTEHETGIINLKEWNLPVLQSVFVSEELAPDEFKSLARRMFAAEAFILISPEYNGSYTPAMKNLLDHFPKQHRKPFGIVTASTGILGGIRAAQQMQLLVNALFGVASPYLLTVATVEKRFDEQGNLLDPDFQKNVDVFVREFLWLAERLAKSKESVNQLKIMN